VPYSPRGFRPENSLEYADRTIYPADRFPNAQWDYQFYYRESFAEAQQGFEDDIRATVKTLFRRGNPAARGKPVGTSMTRANRGWFGPTGARGLNLPRDETVITQDDEDRYTAALTGGGFFGPGSWYMNADANTALADRNKANWRLKMPVLFLHGAYDYVCETMDSRLAEPMREHCANLTEAVVPSGHWMAQERPREVNAELALWLAAQFPRLWSRPGAGS
jgi:pimeloyl-ACP methyl ester carboxylesterase